MESIDRLNFVKISTLLKFIYSINEISTNITAGFWETWQTDSKMYLGIERNLNIQVTLEEELQNGKTVYHIWIIIIKYSNQDSMILIHKKTNAVDGTK